LWVIGGAAEEGVRVSDRELQQQLGEVVRRQSRARVEEGLARSDRTWADFVYETKAGLLAEGIRRVFKKKTAHPTQAQVASYYNTNKQLFGVPERRYLEIARVGTKAEALKIKREIASGKSFASVVKTLPLVQPFFSKEGVVPRYQPHLYHEAALNNAIFAAKPNVLGGPVRIDLGYYIFEVKRVYPVRQSPLARVQAQIRRELPPKAYREALAAWIGKWRARWKTKTDCQPGYVVVKCKQFHGTPPPEDPYTLN
jgi:parvulin-like peptidyl-prolyl isomerase